MYQIIVQEGVKRLEGVVVYLLDADKKNIEDSDGNVVAGYTDVNGLVSFPADYDGAFVRASFLGYETQDADVVDGNLKIVFLKAVGSSTEGGVSVEACKRYYVRNSDGTCSFSFLSWVQWNWLVVLILLVLIMAIVYLNFKNK